MRTVKSLLILLAATIVLFSSCKSTMQQSSNMEEYIPEDALIVVSFNNKQIVEKGELNKYNDFNLYQLLRNEVSNENDKLVSMFDEFMKDTRSSGLNLDKVYIYVLSPELNNSDDSDDYYDYDRGFDYRILFKMDNVKTFESKLKELMATDGESMEPEVKTDYKQLSLDRKTKFIWNDNLLYMLGSARSIANETTFSNLFTAVENNLTKNAEYMEYAKVSDDWTMWISYGSFIDMYSRMAGISLNTFKNIFMFDISKLHIYSAINFENGKAVFKGNVGPKADVDKMTKDYKFIKSDFDNSLLKYFPENAYTVMKLSVNPQEYIRYVKDVLKKVAETKANDDNDSYYGRNEYMMEELNEIFEEETFKTIVNGLEGDVLLSIYDFQQGLIPMPMGSLIINVKNKETYDAIVKLLPNDVFKNTGKFYSIMSGPMSFGYLGFNDNKIFVTTDEKAMNNFLEKGYDKNLGSSVYAKELKSDIFYWNVNLDLETYPEHIKNLLRNAMGREYNIFTSFMIYKNIEYRISSMYGGEVVLNMLNKTSNSLKVILKNLDENISSLMGR